MTVKPIHDRILVRRLEAQETQRGGLVIPDTAKEKSMEGQAIAVGSGRIQENGKVTPLLVKPGDRILIGKYSGTEFKLAGVDHLIVREDQVLGILS